MNAGASINAAAKINVLVARDACLRFSEDCAMTCPFDACIGDATAQPTRPTLRSSVERAAPMGLSSLASFHVSAMELFARLSVGAVRALPVQTSGMPMRDSKSDQPPVIRHGEVVGFTLVAL